LATGNGWEPPAITPRIGIIGSTRKRPSEIDHILVDWHSPPQIGSLDGENQNSTGPEATGDQHNPGADLCDCHAVRLHLALVHGKWWLWFGPCSITSARAGVVALSSRPSFGGLIAVKYRA